MAKGKYKQFVDRIAADIHSGKLSPGTRLSTHREFAAKEGIALATVTKIYSKLESMGLISGEVGRGTFVREVNLPSGHGIDQPPTSAGMIDLNFNYPALPGQSDKLRTALRHLASSGDLDALLRYQPHAGRKNDREQVAKYLENRNLETRADQIFIVSGAQHGLAVSVFALLKPGDVVAVDALTYPGFKYLAETHGLELLSIPGFPNGPDLNALEKLCKQRSIKAVYSMPTVHNPLGWVLSTEQRQRLVEISRTHGLMIIEDAAYAYLDKAPPPPLAAMAPERTIYVSGFSKNIATGLRIGFVVTPPEWASKIDRAIRVTTWNTPALITTIACGWIEDGTVSKLESEKRKDASMRQSIARKIFRGIDYLGHPASYFLWIPLGEEARSDQVVMELSRENISVSNAEPFATTGHVPHAIRLALGSVEPDLLRSALTNVRSVVDAYSI